MACTKRAKSTVVLPYEANGVASVVASLCERLGTATEPGADITQMLDVLGRAVDRIVVEHKGMADELLSAYEQLGAVFEVARRLPHYQSESQIVALIVDTLTHSFAGRIVTSAIPDKDGSWRFTNPLPCPDTWSEHLIDRAVINGSALAVSADSDHAVAEVLVGPVIAGESVVCAIIIARTADQPEFKAVDVSLLDSLAIFCADLVRNLRLLSEVRSLSVSLVRSLVSAVDQKDEYTCGHSLRVAYFAHRLGTEIGMSDEELRMLHWSALLHDVGKIGIRDSVLKKTGKLTAEEFDHIKEHPVRSHQVVQGIPQLTGALDGILHHHERMDGKGYPHGLVGEEIPLQARVIQLADVFDALTSNRAYRSAYSWEQALNIIAQDAGTAIDPALQRRFDAMIRGELTKGPEAWKRMLDEANRFTSDMTNATGLAEAV